MDMLLKGRSAVVTGGGMGIGRGIATVMAREGADVAIGDLDMAAAEGVAKELRGMGRNAVAIKADVSTRQGGQALIDAALKAFGKVDIMVNNAGTSGAPGYEKRTETTDEDWDFVLRVNLMSRVYCCESVVPHMKERRYGKIVNIASTAAALGGGGPYGASKIADIGYTRGLAATLGPYNINANSIMPHITRTPLAWRNQARFRLGSARWANADDEAIWRAQEAKLPLLRGNTPEDIGNLAAFLCSEYARNITGQAIAVDSGLLATSPASRRSSRS